MRHTRTRTGCFTCREDGYKCDEQKPFCGRCVRLNKTCKGYGVRLKWQSFQAPSTSAAGPPSQRRRSQQYAASSPDDGASSVGTGSSPAFESKTLMPLSANPSYLPTEVDPESRYLLHHWTKALATVVSMASSIENPFLVHLTPMLLRAPALRFAISSMAAGHLAILQSNPFFDTVASRHRLRAVSSLRQTIQTQDPELSLATILMLQVSDRLFTTDTKVDHLSGAKAVISERGGPAAWTGSSAQFLLSLCFYHDVLSSISRAASPLLDLNDTIPIEGQASMEGLASVLQLVGLISRMRGENQDVHDAQGHIISEALHMIGDDEEDSGDVGHTTQAYKHAAYIYLNRVWRNEGAPHPSNLAHVERCLFHLSQVPITSPLVSGHAWPLWTAGCEAIDLQQRQFVRDRVDAMFQVRHLPSLRRVKTDIEDVWAFKDTQRNLSGVDNIDCIKAILRSRQREADIA